MVAARCVLARRASSRLKSIWGDSPLTMRCAERPPARRRRRAVHGFVRVRKEGRGSAFPRPAIRGREAPPPHTSLLARCWFADEALSFPKTDEPPSDVSKDRVQVDARGEEWLSSFTLTRPCGSD